MDEKIISAIRNNDIAELKAHSLAEFGFDSVICDALRVIGIISLAELVNCENMQQLITVVDGLSAENKKAFYSICRKANIRISEEMKNVPRIEQSDDKKKFVNGEMLYKYISSVTESRSIAWVKPIKGTENAIALSFLKMLFGKTPSKEVIKSLRCYYSTVRGQAFNDYCLSEFGNFGIDLQFKHSSLLLMYISIDYEASAELEGDEFIVYQLYDEKSEINPFRGLFAIKSDEASIGISIRKNHLYFNNLFNYEDTNKLRLTANIIRLSSYVVSQKHYLYILEKSNAKSHELLKAKKQIELLIKLRDKIAPNILLRKTEEDLLLLKEIEDALDRHITEQDAIDELDLSIRSHNCLKRAGIITIADLIAKTEEDLIKVRNLGRRSLEEVLAVIFAHGFSIKDDPEEPVIYKFGSRVAEANIRNYVLDSDGHLVDFFKLPIASNSVAIDTNEDSTDTPVLTTEDELEKIDLTVRAFNCLKRRGIDKIGDLVELTCEDLGKTRNLGNKNIIEVIVLLFDNGFRLKDCPEELYPTIEAYLIEKIYGGKERILEYFPDGVLNIGSLQGRKLNFDNSLLPSTVVVEGSDELKKKSEELDARESDLDRREKELAEKEERLRRLEAELGDTAAEFKTAREKFEEIRLEAEKKAREEASSLEAREKQLIIDTQAYTDNLALLGQRQAEFEAWAERTRLEIEEEQKKNALTRLVTSLDAIRAIVDAQFGEEKAVLLEGARKELERLQAEADAEIRRVQVDADARIKAKGLECDSLVKATEKKVTDKIADLDKRIQDINTLVSAMKKVIDDITSSITTRKTTLQRTKSQLQTELSAITGMFSTNQRKPLENRIQQIDSEISALDSMLTIINDYKEAMKNEAMFKAMKSVELSFTPDKPSPKATAAKLFSFVETATTAAIERFVGFSETEVVIPSTYKGKPVVAIASKAFAKCNSIKKVVLGSNIRKIGDYAFAECDNLEIVEATNNLTDILTHAFYKCRKLKNFEFGVKLAYIGESAFCETALEKVVLPPKVTEIEPFTFYMCSRLKSVILHDNLLVIDSDAFCDCGSLEIIEIPKSVQKVAQDAFCGRIYDGLREMRVLSPNTDFSYYGKKLGASLFEGGKKLTVYCHADSKAQAFFREKKVTVKPL